MKPKLSLRHKIISEMPYLFLHFLINEGLLSKVVNEQIMFYYMQRLYVLLGSNVTAEEFWSRITLRTQFRNRFKIFDSSEPPGFWLYYEEKWEEFLKEHGQLELQEKCMDADQAYQDIIKMDNGRYSVGIDISSKASDVLERNEFVYKK